MPKLIIGIILVLLLFFAVNSSGRMMDYFIRSTGSGGSVSSGDTIIWDASGDKILWDASGDEVLWE